MELDDALTFARAHRQAVLVTQRANGRPQLSNILYAVDDAGVIRISITADRAKYHNLVRTPWAALHVTQDDFYGYAVLEGPAELAPVATEGHDATVEELVDLYRSLGGTHDDWDDYRRAMVDDRRTVVRLRPDHAYGMVRT
jgi:PPOX class probable F420-dependent enzyme